MVAVALFLRCGDLSAKPLHNDEAINAFKLRELWRSGTYRYDPHEYHGPALYFLSLPVLRTAAVFQPDQPDETSMRAVLVVVGVALILVLLLVADGLSPTALVLAGGFTAVSPSMVYFSRYYIHELLLVLFTALFLGAVWRYHRRPGAAWAAVAGAAVASMYATKETFVFNLAAMVVAGVLLGMSRPAPGGVLEPGGGRRGAGDLVLRVHRCLEAGWQRFRRVPRAHLTLTVGIALAVFVAFFTSFFTNARGPMDALRSYLIWGERAGGPSPHAHPWYFYFERLWWFRVAGGPRWSEGAILLLACIGAWTAFRCPPRQAVGRGSEIGGQGSEAGSPGVRAGSLVVPKASHRGLVVFVTWYTVALAAAYAIIPYKTPWCLLGFQHGLIVLAGVGGAALLAGARRWPTRGAVALLLAVGMGHLGWQAWRATRTFAADFRNPHVYGHTAADIVNLLDQIRAVAAVHPEGNGMPIEVIAPESNYWPLPWYLRRFEHAGWWDHLPDQPVAPVIVAATKIQAGLEERTNQAWRMVGLFELRPRYFVELYVEADLWKRFLAAQ